MKKVEIKVSKKKRVKVDIICKSCKKTFKDWEHIRDRGRKYCSRECVANDKGIGLTKINRIK